MINSGREWDFMDNYDNLDMAARNSYEVIINKKDAIELVGEDEGFFLHLPFEPVNKDVLNDMLEYFEEKEEYEKCIKIKQYIEDEYI